MIRAFFLSSILLYQRCFSPYLGSNCRFHPSCSTYCYESISRYGVVLGLWRGFLRVCRCHPFHPGGFDPVK